MSLETAPEYRPGPVPAVGSDAVVLGGGMAGMLAAGVLADAFDRVRLVEKDPLPDGSRARPGVPQATHVHALLEAGRVTLEALFPGFNDAVESAGGVTIDVATQFHYYHHGDFLADGTVDLPMLCASRPLIESVTRDQLGQRSGVQLRGSTVFREYLSENDGSDVTGVRVTDRNGKSERLSADLVIDATGRASRTSRWLSSVGYTPPPVDNVEIGLAYSTIAVDRPSGRRVGYLVAPGGENHRGGTVVPVEDGRWLVTLFGLHGDHPPTDRDGFRTFAGSLPTPELGQLLDQYTWRSSTASHYPFPSDRWTHYGHLDRWPSGLVTIGDTIASFNPIYGQGMSVAALEALELHAALREAKTVALPQQYLSRVEDVLSKVWLMTVSADHQFSRTTGPKPRGTDVFNWYQNRLIRAAHDDGRLSDVLARVLRFECEPTALAHPFTAARVFSPF